MTEKHKDTPGWTEKHNDKQTLRCNSNRCQSDDRIPSKYEEKLLTATRQQNYSETEIPFTEYQTEEFDISVTVHHIYK